MRREWGFLRYVAEKLPGSQAVRVDLSTRKKEFNALSLDTFFKTKVPQMNYLPVDLLTKDNIDFYYLTEIVSK